MSKMESFNDFLKSAPPPEITGPIGIRSEARASAAMWRYMMLDAAVSWFFHPNSDAEVQERCELTAKIANDRTLNPAKELLAAAPNPITRSVSP